jgi:hypothetical protein
MAGLAGHEVWVRFADGTEGEWDIADMVLSDEVGQPLSTSSYAAIRS